jgi:hypothetical protein
MCGLLTSAVRSGAQQAGAQRSALVQKLCPGAERTESCHNPACRTQARARDALCARAGRWPLSATRHAREQQVPASAIKKCAKCQIRQYCRCAVPLRPAPLRWAPCVSRECQVAHWKAGHKLECGVMARLSVMEEMDEDRNALAQGLAGLGAR